MHMTAVQQPRFLRNYCNLLCNGIKYSLHLSGTPELAITIRQLHCQGGSFCTAIIIQGNTSVIRHIGRRRQLVPPHDKNVIKEVEKIALRRGEMVEVNQYHHDRKEMTKPISAWSLICL